jgi:hypothetical protein
MARSAREQVGALAREQTGAKVRLEWLLTSPKAFGLTTATAAQRAICRAADGENLDELWKHPDVPGIFGGVRPPEIAPKKLIILAGIRGGKSLLTAAKAIAASQNCNLSQTSAGDEIRIPVLATDKDTARVVFSHIVGNLQAKPLLRALMIGDPTAESVWLRHPSGRPIEIKVTAMSKSGSTLVGRWLASCIFDEAPRMAGADDAVQNLEDAIAAIEGRILEGGQILMPGSPWAPFGPIYDLVTQHFGKPDSNVCVVRAPGPLMNPRYWTPERCEKMRTQNPGAHRTDVLGEFADPEEAIFSSVELDAATRPSELRELPPMPLQYYAFAMDPATRGNAWTLVGLTCTGLGGATGVSPKFSVPIVRQWIGSKTSPLKPAAVLAEIAEICKRYRCDTVTTDQHSVDALRDIADLYGLTLLEETINAKNRLPMVENARVLISHGLLDLPNDQQFRTDLLAVKRRITQNGVTLILPKTGDGRHADYVPALGLVLGQPPWQPAVPAPAVDADFERALSAVRARDNADFWERASRRVSRF